MSKKKIAIITPFGSFDPGYSLCSVVKDQLVALVKNGYTPVLFTLTSFKDNVVLPEEVEVRNIIPQIFLEPYAGLNYPPTIKNDIKLVKEAFEEHLKDIDVAITHDLIFIDKYLPFNIGLREADVGCKFFHWIHSAPSPRPELEDNPHASRYTLKEGHKIVYLNHDKAQAIAEMYGAWLKDVRIVPNIIDFRNFYNLTECTERIIDEYKILQADIISIYPLSSTRMGEINKPDGKNLPACIEIHAELKKAGKSTCLIIPNAHANAKNEKRKIMEMIDYAKTLGLNEKEVIFTSILGYDNGVPRETISELFQISNVFIFPTQSENCSLVLKEAELSKNLLVLNKNCSGLQGFVGENALYFEFGSNISTITYDNKQQYMRDVAMQIISELSINKPLKAAINVRQKYNMDFILKEYIEPLFYEK